MSNDLSNPKRRRDAAVVLLALPANGGQTVWGCISVGERFLSAATSTA